MLRKSSCRNDYLPQVGDESLFKRWGEGGAFTGMVEDLESVGSTRLQFLQHDEFEARGMSGIQHDLWSYAGIVCFLPARGAEAPAVTRF